jgi:hypothetical protein
MVDRAREPRQNRVNPWGHLLATPQRGAWTGNRGCLHDAAGQIVRFALGRRWIMCRLEFKGRRRPLLQPGRYTELFFLDEATALAAGHRPCAECLRARYEEFRHAWAAANRDLSGSDLPSATALDAALHADRMQGRQRRIHAVALGELPPGVIVEMEGAATLVGQDCLWRWSFAGYVPGPAWDAQRVVAVLTPRTIVRTLAAGYTVQVHPSVAEPASPLAPR